MTAKELLQAGKLTEAVQALGAELRENPTDAKRRTFLFELLCFAGDFDRAEKQLGVLRQETFAKREYSMMPSVDAAPFTGTLNGKPFTSLSDADTRIGPRLETFAAGTYLWLPLAHVAAIRIEPPRRLRDLLWLPAKVMTGPAFKGMELGEILIPVLSPLTWRHADDEVRLGRATVWEEDENGEEIPFGQKLLLVDGEEVPLLEVRSITIDAQPAAEAAEAN